MELIQACFDLDLNKEDFSYKYDCYLKVNIEFKGHSELIKEIAKTGRLGFLNELLKKIPNIYFTFDDLNNAFEEAVYSSNLQLFANRVRATGFINDYIDLEIVQTVDLFYQKMSLMWPLQKTLVAKWNFYCLVCQTGKISLVEKYHSLLGYHTSLANTVFRKQIMDLYETAVLSFYSEIVKFIYLKWSSPLIGHLLHNPLLQLCKEVKFCIRSCKMNCCHYLTFQEVFRQLSDSGVNLGKDLLLESIDELVQSNCLPLFRWLVYYCQLKGDIDETAVARQIKGVKNVDLLMWILMNYDKKFQISKMLSQSNEAVFLGFIERNDLKGVQTLYHYRSRSMDPINLSVNDFEALYMSVSKGYLRIASWIYEAIRTRKLYKLDLHANYEELFYLACLSGNLDLAQWLYSICIRDDNPINLCVKGGYIFKSVCERGIFPIANWLSKSEFSFKLISNVPNASGSLDYEVYLPNLSTSSNISANDFAVAHRMKHVVFNERKSCNICNEEVKLIISTPCDHTMCFECFSDFYLKTECPLKCFICRRRFSFVNTTYCIIVDT